MQLFAGTLLEILAGEVKMRASCNTAGSTNDNVQKS